MTEQRPEPTGSKEKTAQQDTRKEIVSSENVGQQKENIEDTKETPMDGHQEEKSVRPSTSAQQKVSAEQLQRYITTRLVQGASYREVAKETGLGKSTLNKYFPKQYIDNLRAQLQGQPQPQERPLDVADPMTSVLPTGHLIVPFEWIDDLEKHSPAQQQRIIRAWKQNIIRYNQLVEQQRRNPGTEFSGYPSRSYPGFVRTAEDVLDYETAQLLKAKRRKMLITDNSPGNTIKDTLETAKLIVDMSRPQPQPSSLDIYRTLRQDVKADMQRTTGKSSELDIKLEELRQAHDLDMQRITWEQKKALMMMEADKDKWGAIERTFTPVFQMAAPEIQKTLRNIGHKIGQSLNVQNTQNPNLQVMTCPKCNAELTVPIPKNAPSPINVKCPKCGDIFKIESESEEETTETHETPKGRLQPKYR